MKILHTSDWHLGRKLKEHDRSEEFRKFLGWLECIMSKENPDAFIVSGDIFNSTNPSAEAQEMYYSFLGKIAGKSCRNIVIISGNHDSAPFIDAPAEIMRRCSIHVIGRTSPNEIITLKNALGVQEMIVCAVPFLHDKDIRTVKDNDSFSEASREIKEGIMRHYKEIFAKARELRGDRDIPIVATGHLFLEAGTTLGDEGEHAIYLGTAIKVGTDIFPEDIAYAALGHLHSPQKVGRANIRYSGSPIAMTFGECETQKTVSLVSFEGSKFAGVREIPVPVWQKMERVSGDMAEIERRLIELGELNESVWVEVTYNGKESAGNINDRLAEILEKCTNIEILSVRNEAAYESLSRWTGTDRQITIGDMTPRKMLELYFDENRIPESTREIFIPLYQEILREMELDY